MILAETEVTKARTTAQTVAAFARQLTKERQGTGGMAQLRRMDPLGVPPPIFWKLLADEFGVDPLPPWRERSWAIIIQAMALVSLDGSRATPLPGRALAEKGYPESRFVRLLRADGEALATEIRTLARWSAAKGLAFDWTDLADLVLARESRNPEWAERQAIRLARSYFTAASKKPGTETPVVSGEEA